MCNEVLHLLAKEKRKRNNILDCIIDFNINDIVS